MIQPTSLLDAPLKLALAHRAAEVFRLLQAHPAGLTGSECAAWLNRHPYTIRPRLTGLAEKGLVMDSGRTRKNAAGRGEIVWVVAAEQGQMEWWR